MREHALAIFNAAVSAVQPSSLLPPNIRLQNDTLWLHGQSFNLNEWKRIYVIGAGKASAAMALETEKILGKLLTVSYDQSPATTNLQRKELLDLLLKFYAEHLENLGEFKSVQVLREILG